MPNRWADEPESSEQPKTDLNPLLNPVLEENLGRWAQVYFTNPPETRERAVMDLLRELENRHENGSGQPAAAAAAPAAPATEKQVCAVCQRLNRLDQKFCGFCGAPLLPPSKENLSKAAEPLGEPESAPLPAGDSLSFLGLSSAATDTELDSLRDRPFDKSYYEPDTGRHRGLYIAAALLILIGGITYLTWPMLLVHLPVAWQEAISRPPVRVAASTPSAPKPASEMDTSPAASEPAPPASSSSSASSSGSSSTPMDSNARPTNEPKAPAAAEDKTAEPAPVAARQPASKQPAAGYAHDQRAVTLASESQSSHAGADGSQELLMAQRYLKSGHNQAESSEAARWLWKSVGKQNSRAAVMLADLYVRGDGVSRNCDEARILLGAAAKKGLSEAAQKLGTLDSSCH